jgi:putative ABC transport system permease protein
MRTVARDLLLGARLLAKTPALTAVAILSLGLGIGANTAIFTIVNALFIHSVPVQDPAGLMFVYTLDSRIPGYLGHSYLNYKDYRDLNQVFSGLALYSSIGVSLTNSGEPEPAIAEIVSGNFFDVLGVKTARGRGFQPDEDRVPGASPVAVISQGLWRQRFAGKSDTLGSPIHLNGHQFTVIGVAPPGFRGPNALVSADIWVPMMMYEQVFPMVKQVNSRRALMFTAIGRLKPGMTRAQAEAGLKTTSAQLASRYPQENEGRTVALLPLAEGMINPNLRDKFVHVGQLMSAIVALVLLIACINVANLLLARAGARRKEIAVRISLGATRGRVIRQLLTESLLLGCLGGAAGILIAWWGRVVLWALRPPLLLNQQVELAFDLRVLLFALGLSILTGVVFGLVPALQTSRTDLVVELKERTSQFVGAPHAASLRNLLVVGQVALSLVALIGAGLFVRSLQNAQRIDPGFETEHMLVLTYDLGQSYSEQRGREFDRRVLERVSAVPYVQSAALASNPPFGLFLSRTVLVEGQEATSGSKGPTINVNNVGPEYFRTVSIPIVKGRDFTPFDNDNSVKVAIINQTMAKFFWQGVDAAIGKHFRFLNDATNWQIVGVARDATYMEIGEKPRSMIYLPLGQAYSPLLTLHVHTAGNPALAIAAVRKEVQSLDANLLLRLVRTMPQVISESLWAPRTGAALLSCFGLLALALAIVGIYGVISYSVNQRVRDIGIRMALGAGPMQILREVLGDGFTLVGSGIAAGIGIALMVTHLLASFLFGVSTADPLTFFVVSVILCGVAFAACYLPARKATKVHPSIALRHE